MSAVHRVQSMRLNQGPAYDMIEAMVTGVIAGRMCLQAVGDDQQLFGSCFMVIGQQQRENEGSQRKGMDTPGRRG